MLCPGLLANKSRTTKATSVILRDSKVLFQTASGNLLSLLKTAETSASVGYRRMSYPTASVSGRKISDEPCVGPLWQMARCNNVKLVLTVLGLLFYFSVRLGDSVVSGTVSVTFVLSH